MTDLPDLAPHLRPFVRGDHRHHWIISPFVATMDWLQDAEKVGMTPGAYATAMDARERALARLAWVIEDHRDYVARHTPSFRLGAILDVFEHYGATPGDPEARVNVNLGIAVRAAWHGGGIYANADTWRWVLATLGRSGHDFMLNDERVIFDAMPPQKILYRGFTAPADASPEVVQGVAMGLSWTPHRDLAALYARARSLEKMVLDDTPNKQFIATASVSRTSIAAVISTVALGDEFVVYNPAGINDLTVERISARPASDAIAA